MEQVNPSSRLKLSFKELSELYTPLLILKELLPKEVALYILLLGFQYRKESALDFLSEWEQWEKTRYFAEDAQFVRVNPFKQDYELKYTSGLLNRLEDRFVNASVMYRHGRMLSPSKRSALLYDKAHDLLLHTPLESLSVEELEIRGYLSNQAHEFKATDMSTRKCADSLLCYELAFAKGSREAWKKLAIMCLYGDTGPDSLTETARYLRYGVEICNDGCAMSMFARLLQTNPHLAPDLDYRDLYRKAAAAGDPHAIDLVRDMGL